ncbi:hypothetical protein SESBI_03081 [Sesbania bispinosa]|nr:hypothetical protein SESBI_03081 [Sesbania bispinosa]
MHTTKIEARIMVQRWMGGRHQRWRDCSRDSSSRLTVEKEGHRITAPTRTPTKTRAEPPPTHARQRCDCGQCATALKGCGGSSS